MRKLDLDSNTIGPEGFVAMAEMLTLNCTLRKLDLSHNTANASSLVLVARTPVDGEAGHFSSTVSVLTGRVV